MLAVQMLGNEKVKVREFEEPVPPEQWVVVKVMASALCGSELHGYRASGEQVSNGGHEIAGIVVDASRSRRWKDGDRVGVHAVWGCGKCRWCLAGQYTYCFDKISPPLGGHAQYAVAPDWVLCPLPEECPFDVATLLCGDGFGVPFHANRRLQTCAGEVVIVFGVGPVGLSNTLVQSWLGAQVIAVDINDYRLNLAKQLGAAHTINSRGLEELELVQIVKDITHGPLTDKAIECAGKPETLKLALKCVGRAGQVMCCGEQGDVPINVSNELIRQDITLMGSWYYHFSEYPLMVDWWRRGLPLHKLITDRYPLAQAQEAFQRFAAGETGKVVLEPH